MPAVPDDAVLANSEEKRDPTDAKPASSAERLATEPEAGRVLTTPEGARKPVAEDDCTMVVGREAIQAMLTGDDRAVRVDRDLIAEMQAQLDRERMHRADTLPLPGGRNFDDPTPVRNAALTSTAGKPALSIAPAGAIVPDPQANVLADAAAAAGATAAVSAGITAGSFAAGTFGWADPLVASVVGACALTVVYLTARKFFTGFMRQK